MESAVKEGWIDVGGIPTHVCTWGWKGWIGDKVFDDKTEHSSVNKPILLLLTGNPGIIKYYDTFLDTLYKTLKVPLCVLSHAGHEIPENDKNGKVFAEVDYNVLSQVAHKVEFIETYIPPDKDIFIISHSFGAKITIDLLKQEKLQKRIKKCYLVFPTLERIADTPNGKFIQFVIKYLFSIVLFLTFIFTLFPHSVKWWLIKIYFFLNGRFNFPANCVDATIDLVRPAILRNVFNLASDEMDKIRELDKEVIEKHADKLKVFFGVSDGWAPVEHHKNLVQQVPSVDSRLLNSKYEHCFVFDSVEEFALELSEYIKPELV